MLTRPCQASETLFHIKWDEWVALLKMHWQHLESSVTANFRITRRITMKCHSINYENTLSTVQKKVSVKKQILIKLDQVKCANIWFWTVDMDKLEDALPHQWQWEWVDWGVKRWLGGTSWLGSSVDSRIWFPWNSMPHENMVYVVGQFRVGRRRKSEMEKGEGETYI